MTRYSLSNYVEAPSLAKLAFLTLGMAQTVNALPIVNSVPKASGSVPSSFLAYSSASSGLLPGGDLLTKRHLLSFNQEPKRKDGFKPKQQQQASEQAPIDLESFLEYVKNERQKNPQSLISLSGSQFEGGRLMGHEEFHGLFGDPQKIPKTLADPNNPYLVTDPNFNSENNAFRIIRNADFSNVDLRSINIDGVRFENCNFEGAKMPSSSNAEFVNSNLRLTDWSETKQRSLAIGRGQLELAINSQIDMLRMRLKSPSPEVVDELYGLVKPYFDKTTADVSGANFLRAQLINPNFQGAKFSGAVFKETKIVEDSSDGLMLLKGCTDLDFKDAQYKFIDRFEDLTPSSEKVDSLEKVDLEKLKDNCAQVFNREYANGLFDEFATDGYVSSELLEKLQKNEKIIIKVLFNPDSISKFLTYLSEQDGQEYQFKTLSDATKKTLSTNVIEFMTKLFGEFNFEFVGQDYSGNVDHNLKMGLYNGQPTTGYSNGKIADGDSEILIGGGKGQELNINYNTLFHETFHTLMAFVEFGLHPQAVEATNAVGMKTQFDSLLSYADAIDLVIDGNLYSIKYDPQFSSKGADFLTPSDYDRVTSFLKFMGRQKVEVATYDIANNVDASNLTNRFFFQQFPDKENVVAIDPALKESFAISVHKAHEVVKYCFLPSINLCVENDNIKKDDLVVVFKPKDTEAQPKILLISGGHKQVKIGDEVLFKEVLASSSRQLISSTLNKIFSSAEPSTTPMPTEISSVISNTVATAISSAIPASTIEESLAQLTSTFAEHSKEIASSSQKITTLLADLSSNPQFSSDPTTKFDELTATLSQHLEISASLQQTSSITLENLALTSTKAENISALQHEEKVSQALESSLATFSSVNNDHKETLTSTHDKVTDILDNLLSSSQLSSQTTSKLNELKQAWTQYSEVSQLAMQTPVKSLADIITSPKVDLTKPISQVTSSSTSRSDADSVSDLANSDDKGFSRVDLKFILPCAFVAAGFCAAIAMKDRIKQCFEATPQSNPSRPHGSAIAPDVSVVDARVDVRII